MSSSETAIRWSRRRGLGGPSMASLRTQTSRQGEERTTSAGSREASSRLPELAPHERSRQGVVLLDQHRQIDIDQLPVADADLAVDDAGGDVGRLAEDEGGEGVVDGTSEAKGVHPVADQVGGHPRR